MKITISPTADQTGEEFPHYSASIEVPHDDVLLPDAIGMVHAALVAWGYDPQGIHDAMNEFKR